MCVKGIKGQACSDCFSVQIETRRRAVMEGASQTQKIEMCDATPNTRGVESNEDKTQGQPKAVKRKKPDAKMSRRKMRPRKLRGEHQWHTATSTLLSKHRRKKKAEAKQARKTIRLKPKRVQREKKKKRQLVIHLPVEIFLPTELLVCGGLCQKIQ